MLETIVERLRLKGKALLPLVQGGMGVGISAHRLAGSVAALGAMGTISSVDLRRHHADLMERTHKSKDGGLIDLVNLEALDREIKKAKALAKECGAVAVNIMRAVSQYAAYVRQACESGADAVVVGAGLPLDLPELTADHPNVALIPILSDARGIQLLLRKWMRKNRLPDAIVIENPKYAAGHLGVADVQHIHDPMYAFPRVLEETREIFKKLDIEKENIALIVAGGVNHPTQVKTLLSQGADAIQLGTAFAVTEEGDANIRFKHVLAQARPEEIVTFMSVAGLPARAVRTPWLDSYLHKEPKLQAVAQERACSEGFDCLAHCGLRDGVARSGQFCIDRRLAYALEGDVERGLFFRSSEKLPFGDQIRSVRELMEYLLQAIRVSVPAHS